MKVVIDDKIPYMAEAASSLFEEVVFLPGAEFAVSSELRDADALIVRTRTHCDRDLLADTNVKFVATATIGFDHINTADLGQLGIAWTNCPGCNASSVGQYVRNCLAVLSLSANCAMDGFVVGIVGYGNVGREVHKALSQSGCRVIVNDPPLEESGGAGVDLVSLEELADKCNVITFHTPLVTGGQHPTFHLADSGFFARLKHRPAIINAARGGVVDECAMLKAFDRGLISDMVVDTWENEPDINLKLLDKSVIATPHIAGYSADGKSNATRMALRTVCGFFGIAISDEDRFMEQTAPPPLPPGCTPDGETVKDWLALYNPLDDSRRLKSHPGRFEQLRGNYPLRRESFG